MAQRNYILDIVSLKSYPSEEAHKCSVADPDPGSGAFLTPGSGMGRKSTSGSGIRDEQPGSYFLELRNHFFVFFFGVKIIKFFDADPGSGMETVRIRDGKKSDSGSGINMCTFVQHCTNVHICIATTYFEQTIVI